MAEEFFTKQQVQDLALAAGLEVLREISEEEFQAFLNVMVVELNETAKVMSEEFFESAIKALSGEVSEVATAKARDLANKQAARITGNLSQTEFKKIGETIATGLEEGLGPKEIARRLDQIKGLDSVRAKQYLKFEEFLENLDPPISNQEMKRRLDRFYQKKLKERRETIARTEARDATSTAREVEALEKGKQFKIWMTVGDSRVSEACRENEGEGAIPIKDDFASGHQHPPEHPNCRCTNAYYLEEKIAKREAGVNQGKHADEFANA